MTSIKRRVGAWVVMDVEVVRDMSATLYRLQGPIVESNFLTPCSHSDMPVIAEPFEDLELPARVKLVYFTTKDELDDFKAKKSAGFTDSGLRYFKWNDGWDLVYEG